MTIKSLYPRIVIFSGVQYLKVTDIAKAMLVSDLQIYAAYTRTFLKQECPEETERIRKATEGRLLIPLHLAEIIVNTLLAAQHRN